MWVTRKIVTRAAANLFFKRFSGDIIFSFLVSFAFFVFLFFEIKNIYYDTNATMRTVKLLKKFTRLISGNKNTPFLA